MVTLNAVGFEQKVRNAILELGDSAYIPLLAKAINIAFDLEGLDDIEVVPNTIIEVIVSQCAGRGAQ